MGFFDKDYRQQLRQQRLMEKEQRLKNDPGAIFMRSLAAEAPRALYSLAGNLGIEAAKHHLFGGVETQRRLDKAQQATERYQRSMVSDKSPQEFRQYNKDYGLGLAPSLAPPLSLGKDSPGLPKPTPGPAPTKPTEPSSPMSLGETQALVNSLVEKPAPVAQPTQQLTYSQEALKKQRDRWGYELPKVAMDAAATEATAMAAAGKESRKEVVSTVTDIFKTIRLDVPGTSKEDTEAKKLAVINQTTEIVKSLPPQEQAAAVREIKLAAVGYLPPESLVAFEKKILDEDGRVRQWSAARKPSRVAVSLGSKANQAAKDADALHQKMEASLLLQKQSERRGDTKAAKKHKDDAEGYKSARNDSIDMSGGLRRLIKMEDGSTRYASAKLDKETNEALSTLKRFENDPLGETQKLVNKMVNAEQRTKWQTLLDNAKNDENKLSYIYDKLVDQTGAAPGYESDPLYQSFTTKQKEVVNNFFRDNQKTPEASLDVMRKLNAASKPTAATNVETLRLALEKYGN